MRVTELQFLKWSFDNRILAEAVGREKKVRAGHSLYLQSVFTKVKKTAHKMTLQERVSILNALDEDILSGLEDDDSEALEREIVDTVTDTCREQEPQRPLSLVFIEN